MAEPLTWALVADVAPQHHVAARGLSRGGTRGRSWSRVVMDTKRLTNFRAVPGHSPQIREPLLRPWRPRGARDQVFSPAFEWTREIAEQWAEERNRSEHRRWESTSTPKDEYRGV